MALWASVPANFQVTHAPHANVRVHVPRVIVAIDRPGTAMNAVVPIAARNESVQGNGCGAN